MNTFTRILTGLKGTGTLRAWETCVSLPAMILLWWQLRRLATALDTLFAAWRAGILPLPAQPAPAVAQPNQDEPRAPAAPPGPCAQTARTSRPAPPRPPRRIPQAAPTPRATPTRHVSMQRAPYPAAPPPLAPISSCETPPPSFSKMRHFRASGELRSFLFRYRIVK